MAVPRKKRKTVPDPFPKGKPSKKDIDSTREFLREMGGEAAVAMYDAVEPLTYEEIQRYRRLVTPLDKESI